MDKRLESKKLADSAAIQRALALSALFAGGAFIAQTFLQQKMFGGNAGIGEDFGLATFVPALLISLIWGAVVFGFLAKKIAGGISWAGFALGACLAPIFAAAVSFMLPDCDKLHPNITCGLNAAFEVISLGGLIPEGRKAAAAFHMVFVTSWFLAAVLGLYITARGRIAAYSRNLVAAIVAVLFVAGPAVACGSMGRDISRGQAFTIWSATLFLPMVLLIPLEIAILKKIGGLGNKAWSAYAWCLLAKGLGVVTATRVARHIDWSGMVSDIIGREALYSATHFLVSLGILAIIFKKDSQNVVKTAALISTVIPWLYSLGMAATAFLMLVFYK